MVKHGNGSHIRLCDKRSPRMSEEKKLTHEEFVRGMILQLRQPGYKGIHTVYSGFNTQFRQYYGVDPQPIIDKMVEDGFLKLFIKKGGPIIMLASDYKQGVKSSQGKGKPTATGAKAAKAKAKAKTQNPKVSGFVEQVRRNSQSHTRRSGTIHSKLCSMIATGEISHDDAVTVLRTMENLAWSRLSQVTQWIDDLEKHKDPE